MSREDVARIVAATLTVERRRDGFLWVTGIHDAYAVAGLDPRGYLDDRRADVRWFADELHRFARRLVALSEVAA